jgi:hypothetical protein
MSLHPFHRSGSLLILKAGMACNQANRLVLVLEVLLPAGRLFSEKISMAISSSISSFGD